MIRTEHKIISIYSYEFIRADEAAVKKVQAFEDLLNLGWEIVSTGVIPDSTSRWGQIVYVLRKLFDTRFDPLRKLDENKGTNNPAIRGKETGGEVSGQSS